WGLCRTRLQRLYLRALAACEAGAACRRLRKRQDSRMFLNFSEIAGLMDEVATRATRREGVTGIAEITRAARAAGFRPQAAGLQDGASARGLPEEMPLSELRRAPELAQTTIGELLGMSQPEVSKLEQRS